MGEKAYLQLLGMKPGGEGHGCSGEVLSAENPVLSTILASKNGGQKVSQPRVRPFLFRLFRIAFLHDVTIAAD